MTRSHGTTILLRNATLLEPRFDEPIPGYDVLIEGAYIKDVSARPIRTSVAEVIDCGVRTVMPGLIDCHVHAFLSEVDLTRLEHVPVSLLATRAVPLLKAMLDRGFTTVRDAGGADWGIREAIRLGYIAGPRLFISGRAIGQTGGHSDMRRRTDQGDACRCCNALRYTMATADGADAVRAAVREELRQGADAIKIMVSGGVASPHDPLESRQFTVSEISAAVEEAQAFGRYVLAHAYTAEAITRAVSLGVRTIEHANLIDEPSAQLAAERGAYVVPTLVAYVVMKERAGPLGMTADKLAKNKVVLDAGLSSLEVCRSVGVKLGFGSDLLGELQSEQSREFLLRSEVMPAIDIIRSATIVGAEIIGMAGKLGTLQAGAFADLLIVDGDPLQDLGLLQAQGRHLSAIMQNGRFHKRTL